ncbi:hypothetical protein HG530_003052 [Fusarium avenaceum]|nr:hypothetical protein HG530_003052 [Fusarium avenaceum]
MLFFLDASSFIAPESPMGSKFKPKVCSGGVGTAEPVLGLSAALIPPSLETIEYDLDQDLDTLAPGSALTSRAGPSEIILALLLFKYGLDARRFMALFASNARSASPPNALENDHPRLPGTTAGSSREPPVVSALHPPILPAVAAYSTIHRLLDCLSQITIRESRKVSNGRTVFQMSHKMPEIGEIEIVALAIEAVERLIGGDGFSQVSNIDVQHLTSYAQVFKPRIESEPTECLGETPSKTAFV